MDCPFYTFLKLFIGRSRRHTAGNKFLLVISFQMNHLEVFFFSFQTYGDFQAMLLLMSKFITLFSENGVYMISVPWYLLRFLL